MSNRYSKYSYKNIVYKLKFNLYKSALPLSFLRDLFFFSDIQSGRDLPSLKLYTFIPVVDANFILYYSNNISTNNNVKKKSNFKKVEHKHYDP